MTFRTYSDIWYVYIYIFMCVWYVGKKKIFVHHILVIYYQSRECRHHHHHHHRHHHHHQRPCFPGIGHLNIACLPCHPTEAVAFHGQTVMWRRLASNAWSSGALLTTFSGIISLHVCTRAHVRLLTNHKPICTHTHTHIYRERESKPL